MRMQVVLAIPVAGLLAGAACGLRWPDVPINWLAALLCGLALLAVHAARVDKRALLLAAVLGAFAIGGTALGADAWHRAWRPSLRLAFESIAHQERIDAERAGRPMPEDDSAAVVLVGVLNADASRTQSGGVSLSMEVEWIGRLSGGSPQTDAAANPVSGGVLLTVLGALAPDHVNEWRTGRRIRAPADLRRVSRYLDPGVPDQERAMARRGVSLVGTIKSAALVDVLARGSPPAELAARLRAFTRRAVADSVGVWSTRAAAIISAIVIGDRTGLDDEVQRRLQEAGTYHVLAISGGNIAILAGLTLALFRILGMLGRTAMLSAAAGLCAYGFVVGGGASVDRAVLMAVVYFIGRASDLRAPPYQPLVLAAGVLALADPLSVADASTLLTFGATAAILAAMPAVSRRTMPRLLAPAAALLVASAASEAALLPVSATFFSRVTFAGLVLNFIAIPLMAVAQLAGMAVVPLYAASSNLAKAAGWIAFAGAEGLVGSADLVVLAPWLTWRVPPPTWLEIVIYYAAAIGAWFAWRRGTSWRRASLARWVLSACAVVAAVWLLGGRRVVQSTAADGRLHVTFLDVGQGDAALVRFPRGGSMLIDTGGLPGGGSFDIGDRVVAPVLRPTGIARLSTLALTHGDADHVGGALSVLREFRPWDVWDGVPVPPLALMQRLRAEADATGVRWTSVQRNDSATIDGVRIRVLHPPLPDWERQDVRNDDSIVLDLRWRDVSMVFTGDIGRDAEADIEGLFEPSPLRILKVPHHGSNTSSSEPFISALAPDVAVVSVGRSNNFGHPSRTVLERYAQAGVTVFRTDQDGAVTVDTDGTALHVSTFTGRRLTVSTITQPRESLASRPSATER